MNRLPALPLIVSLLGGCSVVFGADPDRIQGVDGSVEDGGVDGGVDAGDADICLPREDCATDFDEDCNGLAGCDDFACASELRCCGGDGALMTLALGDLRDWVESESAVQRTMTHITDFDTSTGVKGIRRPGCVPLSLGMRFTVDFEVRSSCAGGACPYAAFVLTPSSERPMGAGWLADLAVEVQTTADGARARLRRGADVLTTVDANIGAASPVTAIVDLTPGPNERGGNSLFLRARFEQGSPPVDLLDEAYTTELMPIEDLRLAAAACGTSTPNGDGLYPAFEGRGDAVRVGRLTAGQRSCENPSRSVRAFDAAGGEHDDLGLDGWAAGGVGNPSLTFYRADSGPRVELWVDGSDLPRDQEPFRVLDFRIGATQSSDIGATWGPPRREGDPMTVAREPAIWAPVDHDDNLVGITLIAVVAVEGDEGGYEIHGTEGMSQARGAALDVRMLLEPGVVEGCRSLRHPNLLARHPNTAGPGRFWLLFTCERGSGQPSDLRAIAVSGSLAPVGPIHTLLDGSVGPYASRGVFGAEGVSDMPADPVDPVIHRLYFMARDASGTARIAYAEARELPSDEGPPVFLPYPANPILGPNDPVLDCPSGCALEGVGATRLEGSTIRLMVARSRADGTSTRYEVVPLNQVRRRN